MVCYAYLRIIKTEKNPKLLNDWWFCSIFAEAKRFDENIQNRVHMVIKQFCEERKLNYSDIYQRFYKGHQNEWLISILGKSITFSKICKYINEKELYDDYRSACAFIHGQSIITKLSPFTFYRTIFQKLFSMVTYIFKSIRLFSESRELEAEMQALEGDLWYLSKTYLR